MDSFDDLKKIVDEFLSGNDDKKEIIISDDLRRCIRQFKNLYPTLIYFAYVIPHTDKNTEKVKNHRLVLSKSPMRIDFKDLTMKARNLFLTDAAVKMDPGESDENIKKLYDILNLGKWFDMLSDLMMFLGSEQDFISKSYTLKKEVTDDIVKSPNYNSWMSKNVSRNKFKLNVKKSGNIYMPKFVDKYFLSIDMKMANFQILHNEGLIQERTWAEFMKKFVDHPYFSSAKHARMIILSDKLLKPKKWKVCYENVMGSVLDSLLDSNIFTAEMFAVFNGDEVIFCVSKEEMMDLKEKVVRHVKENFGKWVINVEVFQLHKIDTKKPSYAKINQETGAIVYKCVDEKVLLEIANRNLVPKIDL